MAAIDYQIEVTLTSILIQKVIDSTRKGFLLSPVYKHLKGNLHIGHKCKENQQHINLFIFFKTDLLKNE